MQYRYTRFKVSSVKNNQYIIGFLKQFNNIIVYLLWMVRIPRFSLEVRVNELQFNFIIIEIHLYDKLSLLYKSTTATI